MSNFDVAKSETLARTIREHIIAMLLEAASGHPGGALGLADVFATIYSSVLTHNPKQPDWPERDRLLLSNGHTNPVLYATLAEMGYFPTDELMTLRKINSRLQGHPHVGSLPGVENSGGPLGQGLSQGVGMALAFQMDGTNQRVYVVMGDGEQQEGQNWEAYWFAGVRKLNAITVLIDRNNIQIDGKTEDILPLEPFKDKLEAFNWHVLEIDGHNHQAIFDACQEARAIQQKPTAVICNTIPGKGVEFMENLPEWHGKAPNVGDSIEALQQLRTLNNRITFDT